MSPLIGGGLNSLRGGGTQLTWSYVFAYIRPSLQSMAFFAEISGVENQIYRSGSGISNLRSRYFTRILSAGVVRNLKSAAGVGNLKPFLAI